MPAPAKLGVDKGYTEALIDSDGQHHGTGLGLLLTAESDRLQGTQPAPGQAALDRQQRPATRRPAKADRIHRHNLGTVKRDRQAAKHQARVRTEIFTAVHRVVDKAAIVVAEDLTRSFAGRKQLGKDTNRRLAGVDQRGHRRGAHECVGAQRFCAHAGQRRLFVTSLSRTATASAGASGDRLHCTPCRVVSQADHARRDQHPAQTR